MATRPAHRLLGLLSGSATVVAIDQITKAAAAVAPAGWSAVVLPVRNDAFSLQLAHAERWTAVLVMAIGVAAAAALAWRWTRHGMIPVWAAALAIGGAVSNLADRAALGAVRDFLVVGPAVINLADVAVLVGIAVTFHCRVGAGRKQASSAT